MKGHFKLLLAGIAALAIGGTASAHAIWLERDGAGPVRVYLDEVAPKEPEPDESQRLKTSVVFTSDPAKAAALTPKTRHFEAAVTGTGDVRLRNDNVFAPWTEEGQRYGQVYHARAGRTETAAKLDFEFVPVKAGGDSFTLLFRGKPVPNAAVSVFSPKRVETKLTTDAAGRITIPAIEKGRYILEASTSEKGQFRSFGEEVQHLNHVTTLSYVNG